MLQRVCCGVVRGKFCIEIADDSDADGITHASIVLDEPHRLCHPLDRMH
jgi:hypothetical protein